MNHEFIKRFNERDEVAFKLVFNLLYPKFLKMTERRIGNHHDAEDIVLNIFGSLWVGGATFKEFNGIEAYLYYCARNSWINYNSRRRYYELTDYDIFETEEEVYDPKNRKRLQELIKSLPKKSRQILLLQLEGHTDKEISKIIKIKYESIHQMRWWAIKKIKSLLNK